MIGVLKQLKGLASLPRITIDLMHGRTADNDPFYGRVVQEFYATATRRHPKFPLIRRMTYGVAVCCLPPEPDGYQARIESSARRNYKKAQRMGYAFGSIDFNAYLADIAAIRSSAQVRQGRMPEDYLQGTVQPCANPPSRTAFHDYPYFGVVKDGHLVAYAGVLVAGELAMIEHIMGHAACQADGVVPMLLIGMGGAIRERYPQVKYYAYGTFFGAGDSMQRFKTKFCFLPHRVKWVLG